MRIGVTLPSFTDDAESVLDAASRAEALGLHGVFVFDHLWPMGRPDRPALSAFPLLGALAAATSRICLGPLVARIGLVPDEVLTAEFLSLARLAPGRLVAGLGTGDAKSAAENRAYGIAFVPAPARRLSLAACARRLRDSGVRVWVGGGSPATSALASELGVALNLWEADTSELSAARAHSEVTWAGPMPSAHSALVHRLDELDDAGASWAVCAWPESLETLAGAARARGDLQLL